MAEVVSNPEFAVCVTRVARRRLRIAATTVLAVVTAFTTARAAAQNRSGPLTQGQGSSEILFVPATLNPVSGFNPANGHLNGAGYGGDTMLANSSSSQFSYPVGMAYDSNGNLFIADESNYIVRRIDAVTGELTTFAGTPKTFGLSPATGSGPATSALLGNLSGLVIDSNNNVYVADRIGNNVVWKITPGGTISIFAGNGTGTCSGAQTDTLGDGCPASDATLDNPWALGIDANNNIYIADSYNDLVRVVSSTTGKISVFAGVVADAGTFGDCNASPYSVTGSGPFLATQAHLCFPEGIAFDTLGNTYISNATGDTVQVINSSGYISTLAGTRGTRSFGGDGGPAVNALLNEPAGLYVDAANRLYISDFFNEEVRVVDSSGNINDVMGTTHGGLNNSSIGGPDTEAIYNNSTGQYSGAADGIYSILMDPYGNILATDSSADAITSAGTTGQYFFGNNNQIYQTATTTSLNATSAFYPPYITISNPSATTLNFTDTPTVTTLTPSATPAAFAIAGGTCSFPGSLASGDSCTVIVSFTPTEGGTGAGTPYTGTIVIDSNSNSSPNTINLSGNGIGTCTNSATLTSSLTFSSPPNVPTATQNATITNNGNCPYSTSGFSPAIVNPNPATPTVFSVVSNNCPATLNQNATCTISIGFTPTAVTSYSAQMQVTIPNYGNIRTFLSGTGITAPAVSFNPTSIAFPTTADGTTATSMGTVMTNVGNAPLNNIVITLAGSNPTYFAFNGTNNCGSTLAAGAFCTISVDFTPQAALTSYAAAISVADGATGSPQTVALSGTANAALPPVVINDNETIHTADTPALTPSILIADNETIQTTDTPALTPSLLIQDAETIHTTDSLVLTSLTSPTTTVLTSTTATPAAGSSVTFTATVTSTAGTPAGLVNFYDGTNLIGSGTLTGGIATFTTSSLSDGSHSISAVYAGTATFLTSTSNALPETVTASTVTQLTSTTATPAFGAPVTFTATVSSTAGTPTGIVTFYDGTNVIGSATLTGGIATFTTSSLSDGPHSISAVYAGTALFLTSTSNTLSETVTASTVTLLTSTTATPAAGNPVTFTAAVTSAAGTPTGIVTFYDGTNLIGSGTLTGGIATFTTSSLSGGVHSISAIYAGTTLFLTSTSNTLTETVATSTTTQLTSTTATPAAGNPVTFTAAVTSTAGTPIGIVTFYDGTAVMGSGTLTGGIATFTTSSLSDGAHSISAVYAGTALFLTSTSNALSETVTDFSLSLGGTGGVTLTILPGASGTYTITLTPPSSGYTGTITLSISGLPTGATGTFSPNPVTLSGTTTGTSTLTISVPPAMAQVHPADSGPMQNRTLILLGLLLPLLGLSRGIKRSWLRMLSMLLLSAGIAMAITSCGGPFFTQPQESYTLTITGTSGSDQHSATMTLIVP